MCVGHAVRILFIYLLSLKFVILGCAERFLAIITRLCVSGTTTNIIPMMPAKKKRYCSGSVDCKKGSSSMSEKQKSLMIDFLTDNPSMVRDRSVGGTSNRDDRDELWEKLASMLNSCGAGAQKDGGGWRRVSALTSFQT